MGMNKILAGLILATAFSVLVMNAANAVTLTVKPSPFQWTPGNVIDVGQGTTANTVVSGGNPPYSGNWVWALASGNTITLANTISQPLPTATGCSGSCTSNVLSLVVNAVTPTSLQLTFNGVVYSVSSVGSGNTIYGVWTFTGNSIDSTAVNAIVGTTNTLTINPTPTATAVTPSNAVLDSGQYVTFNALIFGGSLPITANIVFSGNTVPVLINGVSVNVGNTITTIVIGAGGETAYSNVITFNTIKLTDVAVTGGSVSFNVIAVDHAGVPVTFNSVPAAVTLDPAPTANTPTTSNAVLDSGQYVIYNALIYGGNVPITANLVFSGNTVPVLINGVSVAIGNTVATSVILSENSVTGQNAITFNAIQLTDLVAATGTVSFNVIAVDSANTPVTFNSPLSNTVILYAAPTIQLTATPSNSLMYGANAFTVNALITGGTGPGNFMVSWALNGAAITPNVVTANTQTSNTLAALTAAGSYAYTVTANDVGTSSVYAFSASNTVVVAQNSTLGYSATGDLGSTSYYSGAVSTTFTGTPTVGNQIGWSLYVNGTFYAASNSIITWSDSAPGIDVLYSFVFGNAGNGNYVANTLDTSLTLYIPAAAGGGSGGGGGGGPAPTSTTVSSTTPTTATTTVATAPAANNTVNTTISSSAPVLLNLTSAGATVAIFTSSPGSSPVTASVSNVTSTAPSAPAGYTLVDALNVNITTDANVTENVTMAYPCGTPQSDIMPFIYKNGSWSAITPFSIDAAKCTVTFALPKDPIVALFSSAPVTTTAVTTTVPKTTVTTTVPAIAQPSNSLYVIAAIVIVVIIVIALVAYYYSMRSHRHRRHG